MACNKKLSSLDTAQAVKRVIDCEHDAVRVVQALNTEMYIQVSAEDSDSVESVARSRVVTPEDGAVDCSRMRKVCNYGTSGLVEISADGETFIDLLLPQGMVKELCAMKIRTTLGKLVIQS